MPRNGSGTYTLPAGNPVQSGTTISSTVQNNTMSDVATALSDSLTADGQKQPTANLPMAGFKHTGVGNATDRSQYAAAGQVQDNSLTWCGTAGGTANAITFSPNPPITAYVVGQSFTFQAGASANTGATTIVISGLTAIDLQVNGVACSGGEIQPDQFYEVFIDTTSTAQLRDVSKSVDSGTSIISIDASVASNILTCTLNPVSLDFRSATLGSGTVNTRVVPSAITVAVPSTATLGTQDGVLARLILIAIDNAGTVELAIANWTSPAALDESGLISTTTISTAADSANVFYSTTGRSNVPYRVVGFVEVTQVTAGTWVAPSTIQGVGGEALVYLGLPAAVANIPVRQTVLRGPVDSNGLPSFGGSTGGTTVTASGALLVTAANGFNVNQGMVDRVGSITNPSWTGLSTNGTMYLYLDIAADGTCTTGSTTLAPTYRWGGADVVTNNQFTFNIQEMVGKVGNGTTAAQTYRVFAGEVTVAGGVVTVITWYSLMGRYRSANVATIPGASTPVVLTSNLGITPRTKSLKYVCTTADAGYAVGDELDNPNIATASFWGTQPIWASKNGIGFTTSSLYSSWAIPNKTTGASTTLTNTSWAYFMVAERGW